MNTEEKARAYDEALERAKQVLSNNCTEVEKLCLECVFPQLSESEDERIRKWLIEMVEVFRKANPTNAEHNGDCSEAIAYLERQKEPAPVPDKFSGLKSLMLQYLQSAANRKDDAEIEDDTDLYGRKILDYVWKYDEKQKEQKPAEWSEEDNNALKYIHELISFGYTENFFDAQTAADMRTWLNSHFIHWKPSEEQMWVFLKANPVNLMPEELSIYKSLCNDLQKQSGEMKSKH